jgi:hypothetical protein
VYLKYLANVVGAPSPPCPSPLNGGEGRVEIVDLGHWLGRELSMQIRDTALVNIDKLV